MNLILRLIRTVIAALLRPPLGVLDLSEVRFRVWPNDLDLNLHMNNGRYFTIMDLGRIDLMVRAGMARRAWREGWTVVVGSETIQFRRPLRPFRAYTLKTRVLCWDERWVFLEQRFEAKGELAALGLVKGMVIHDRRTLRPREVLKAMGLLRRSPPMPPAIKAWALAEEWTVEPRAGESRGAEAAEGDDTLPPPPPPVTTEQSSTPEAPLAKAWPRRFPRWRRRA